MHSSPLYIWQSKNWPNFSYDNTKVMAGLESCIQAVAPLKQLSKVLSNDQQLDWEAAILLDETLASGKIEGELYDRDSVRSSIVNKLGIRSGTKFNKQSDAMVELLLSAIRSSDHPITHDVIKQWHHILFPVAPLPVFPRKIPLTIGDYRNDTMQIISGQYGK